MAMRLALEDAITLLGFRVQGFPWLRWDHTPKKENHMEKKMEHEMESVLYKF